MANSKVEDALMKRLKAKGLDESSIKQVSNSIAKMQTNGFLINQVLVRGLPPFTDNLLVKGKVSPSDLGKILGSSGRFGKFKGFPGNGFPIGMPPPELLEVSLEVNIVNQ